MSRTPTEFKPKINRATCATFLFALAFGTANGQLAYRDVHDFARTPDGEFTHSSVTFDKSGNAHGTAEEGGLNNDGMVWEATANGAFVDQHDFGGKITNANGSMGYDGTSPVAGVCFDNLGNMFGVASFEGATEFGMLWEITASGVYKDRHDFGETVTLADGTSGQDGETPLCAVTADSSGDVFGTTESGGGNNQGMVWELTAGGVYKDLHDFGETTVWSNRMTGTDGFYPVAGVTVAGNGDLYGTTTDGGANQQGNIWEIVSGGTYKDIHDFGGTVTLSNGSSGMDGILSNAVVTVDSSNNLYGTAEDGGANNIGMVWKITYGGAYEDLHDFGGTITNADGTTGPDGILPIAGVSLDGLGNLYGTAGNGGPNDNSGNGDGMVWEITKSGTYEDLHDFGGTVTYANGASGTDGEQPLGGVSFDSARNLYGTAYEGGSSRAGMVWSLANGPKISGISLNPNTIGGLGSTTATVALAGAAPVGGSVVSIHPGASGYLGMPSLVMIQAGATTATFNITGTAQRPSTLEMGVFASNDVSSAEAILTIQGDSLKSLTLSPSLIKWTSGTATATVSIASAAPPGGWLVTLTPGVSGYVNMPATVTVPAGSTSTTCSITGSALHFFTLDLGITASDGGSKATTMLVIAGDAVKNISLSPSTIGWKTTSTATINLVVAAPPGGWLVNVNPGAPSYVSMPTSVTVPAGATSATFTITAGNLRSSSIALGIYANDGPSNQSAILTIQGDSIQSLTLSPSTIGWSGTSIATFTLASAAPYGGWTITVYAGAPGYVSMDTTVILGQGDTSGSFFITGVSQRSSTLNLGIFASDGVSTKEAVLTLTGTSIKSLTLSPSSVAPGVGSTGTITLNSVAPFGGWVVNLTVGVPSSVGVPPSVTVPAGSSSVIFPITTNASDPASSVGIIAKDGVSSQEAVLTIT